MHRGPASHRAYPCLCHSRLAHAIAEGLPVHLLRAYITEGPPVPMAQRALMLVQRAYITHGLPVPSLQRSYVTEGAPMHVQRAHITEGLPVSTLQRACLCLQYKGPSRASGLQRVGAPKRLQLGLRLLSTQKVGGDGVAHLWLPDHKRTCPRP